VLTQCSSEFEAHSPVLAPPPRSSIYLYMYGGRSARCDRVMKLFARVAIVRPRATGGAGPSMTFHRSG
jgi:hypothetical protein